MSLSSQEDKALRRFCTKHSSSIRELARTTHFDADQLRSVINIYYKLLSANGPAAQHITRSQFREFLQCVLYMAEDRMINRCMIVLDRGVTVLITLETWTLALSLFLFGTLEEKCRYCFAVYDESGDGHLQRDRVLWQLRWTVIRETMEEVDEMCKDIADQLVKRLDLDADGAISFDDYHRSVQQRPALMQMLGKCLPERADVFTFLSTFTDNCKRLCAR